MSNCQTTTWYSQQSNVPHWIHRGKDIFIIAAFLLVYRVLNIHCHHNTIRWLICWAHPQWLGPQSLLQYSLSQSGFWPCTGFGAPGDCEPPTLFWYSAWMWENPCRLEKRREERKSIETASHYSLLTHDPVRCQCFLISRLYELCRKRDKRSQNHTSFTNMIPCWIGDHVDSEGEEKIVSLPLHGWNKLSF